MRGNGIHDMPYHSFKKADGITLFLKEVLILYIQQLMPCLAPKGVRMGKD